MAKKSLTPKKASSNKEPSKKEKASKGTSVAFDAKDLARNAALDVAKKGSSRRIYFS
jgi:hypothetical protein